MTSLLPRFVTLAAAALVLAPGVSSTAGRAAEPAILAQARAYLGPEALLDGVNTIHFFGTITATDPADSTKTTRTAVEVVFQKPDRQRIVKTSDQAIEITALDGYDAWQRIQSVSDPTKVRQNFLGSLQIKRLRASTSESLSFYRGLEQRGGRIEDMGTVTVDGVAYRKVAFIYAPDIIFYRYFDPATGRLVYSETESGEIQREQGEIMAGGLHFSKSVKIVTKNATGQSQTVTIDFAKVVLNESLPDALFRVPLLKVN
jgi:outer membrane lipoprotein-sorting protein